MKSGNAKTFKHNWKATNEIKKVFETIARKVTTEVINSIAKKVKKLTQEYKKIKDKLNTVNSVIYVVI